MSSVRAGSRPAAAPDGASAQRPSQLRPALREVAGHALLTVIAVVALVPLYWMITTSLRPDGLEFTYPPQWIPTSFLWENYIRAWRSAPFDWYTLNSVTITATATAGTVLTASLSAYGFARLRFFGRDAAFVLVLATLMLPGWVTLIPQYMLFKQLGWVNTLLPMIVPSWFGGGAFYIFLLRQFLLTLPIELEEAAQVDGASTFRIYWQIMLPLAGPALASVAIFSFINHWNDFLHPLIYTSAVKMRTLALGLRYFVMGPGNAPIPQANLMMAASTMMLIPVLIIFFSAQKYFVRGVTLSGLAGR